MFFVALLPETVIYWISLRNATFEMWRIKLGEISFTQYGLDYFALLSMMGVTH